MSDQRLLDAPDRFRAQARSLATLVASGAGAVAAGLLFGQTTGSPGSNWIWIGSSSLLLLVLSLLAFAAASIYSKPGKDGESEEDSATRLAEGIRCWMSAGGWLASIALAGLVLLVFLQNLPTAWVTVHVVAIEKNGVTLADACPGIGSDFEAEIQEREINGTGPRTLRIADCGGSPTLVTVDPATTNLLILRRDFE